jgi:hypothetical protein
MGAGGYEVGAATVRYWMESRIEPPVKFPPAVLATDPYITPLDLGK